MPIGTERTVPAPVPARFTTTGKIFFVKVALTVFAALRVIQFLGGSYMEPRLTGARLAVSPFMVLAAVFFGSFLWCIPSAFIGVQALIAVLTLYEEFPQTRWIAALLSGRDTEAGDP